MNRKFKEGVIIIDGILYETVNDYDLSILSEPVLIDHGSWQGCGYVWLTTENERNLLGTKARFITLRILSDR